MPFVTILAQSVNDVSHPDLDSLSHILGAGSLVSLVVAGISALGAQIVRPWLTEFYADRKHRREFEALDMANDLQHTNTRIRELEKLVALLTEENVLLKQEVAHTVSRLDVYKQHWTDSAPPPEPPRSSDAVPVLPLPKPEENPA